MHTEINEIAPDTFRLSTFIPEVAAPAGFSFNQFLIRGEEPFLFHTGMRDLFPLVSEAVASLLPLERLRWLSFAHVEADECGAMNSFLAAAPSATVVHGELACGISLNDLADRPPRPMPADGTLDIGGHLLRFLPTPHVPHNWESGLWFDETTRCLLAGDLLGTVGQGPAVTEADVAEPAFAAEAGFQSISSGGRAAATLRDLARLEPEVLAIMHGSSFRGDGAAQLRHMADLLDPELDASPVPS